MNFKAYIKSIKKILNAEWRPVNVQSISIVVVRITLNICAILLLKQIYTDYSEIYSIMQCLYGLYEFRDELDLFIDTINIQVHASL